jgi:hypothetical protein
MQSSRAQQLARVPWEEIEGKIDAQTAKNERASPSRIVKELLQEQQRQDNVALVETSARQVVSLAISSHGKVSTSIVRLLLTVSSNLPPPSNTLLAGDFFRQAIRAR